MTKNHLLIVVAVLAILMLLAACGGAPEPETVVEQVEVGAPGADRVVEAETVVEEVVVDELAEAVPVERAPPGQTVVEEVVVEATAAPQPTPAPGSPGLAAPYRAQAERMIIKNAELDLLVSDTDVALDGITVIAADYGGYIISSHTWFENEFKYATVRLGVPVVEFENILRRLRGLALKVNSEVASGEDVTDQYVDLQSRLTNLQATRDRIREFLDKAETVEEALQVNRQLSEVEAEIEEIQGRMNYLKDRAAYSTIDVQLNPQRPTPTPSPTPTPTPTPTPEAWRPGETLEDATGVLTSVMKGLVDLAIWVIVVLGPFLVPVALLIWLVIWLRRRRARSASPPEPPESPSSDS